MLFIHQTNCISPQQTFPATDLAILHPPAGNKLRVIEPGYAGIPPGILRRMSKAIRIAVGAALPLLKQFPAPEGIIIGTANAGMEDSYHFLKQIIDFDEGLLAPGSFVQSTPNAIAAQLSMLGHNNGYNITHVHLGLAFENAITDTVMLLAENPANTYLLGAVDDIATYNFTLNSLAGWYKSDSFGAGDLYGFDSAGSLAGEGAVMFRVNGNPEAAVAGVQAVEMVHTDKVEIIDQRLKNFLNTHLLPDENIGLLVSGENGDSQLTRYYASCETTMGDGVPVIRFKHMCGEYPTASAFALWLSCYLLQTKRIPAQLLKKGNPVDPVRNILIYNTYKGVQHSFMLVKGMPVTPTGNW